MLGHLLPGKPGGSDPLAQGVALEELGDGVVDPVGGAHIVDVEEVGVRQSRQRLGLALEPLEPVLIRGKGLGQDLDRHLTVELGVERPPHLTHPTGPDGAEDFVTTETITL